MSEAENERSVVRGLVEDWQAVSTEERTVILDRVYGEDPSVADRRAGRLLSALEIAPARVRPSGLERRYGKALRAIGHLSRELWYERDLAADWRQLGVEVGKRGREVARLRHRLMQAKRALRKAGLDLDVVLPAWPMGDPP